MWQDRLRMLVSGPPAPPRRSATGASRPDGRVRERTGKYAGFATRELVVDGQGPTILLLHGFGQSPDVWRGVLERLAGIGHAAVAPELPGARDSRQLGAGPRVPQQERFVRAAVETLGAGNDVVLVGNSLGGTLAARVAAEPDLPVRGLVVLGIAGLGWAPLLRSAMTVVPWLVPLAAYVWVPRALFTWVLDQTYARLVYGDPRQAATEVLLAAARDVPDLRFAARLVEHGAVVMGEVETGWHLERVACPTVAVHGDRDLLVSRAAAHAVRRAIADCRLVVLPEAGHCPQLDDPAAVTDIVLGLVARTRAAGGGTAPEGATGSTAPEGEAGGRAAGG